MLMQRAGLRHAAAVDTLALRYALPPRRASLPPCCLSCFAIAEMPPLPMLIFLRRHFAFADAFRRCCFHAAAAMMPPRCLRCFAAAMQPLPFASQVTDYTFSPLYVISPAAAAITRCYFAMPLRHYAATPAPLLRCRRR